MAAWATGEEGSGAGLKGEGGWEEVVKGEAGTRAAGAGAPGESQRRP